MTSPADRNAKLAQALRDNLSRRKAQARQRRADQTTAVASDNGGLGTDVEPALEAGPDPKAPQDPKGPHDPRAPADPAAPKG
ncbi:MAG: hypothetical protein ACPGOY_06130 [Rhodospirillaceae bacterium]